MLQRVLLFEFSLIWTALITRFSFGLIAEWFYWRFVSLSTFFSLSREILKAVQLEIIFSLISDDWFGEEQKFFRVKSKLIIMSVRDGSSSYCDIERRASSPLMKISRNNRFENFRISRMRNFHKTMMIIAREMFGMPVSFMILENLSCRVILKSS